mgnify:CR=1 FL=1
MFAVPSATPDTVPDASTGATAVLLLLQVPPASPLVVYVAVAPIHNGVLPLTVPAFTFAFTVKDCDAVSATLPQPTSV